MHQMSWSSVSHQVERSIVAQVTVLLWILIDLRLTGLENKSHSLTYAVIR